MVRDAEVVAICWEELLANRDSAALGEELHANLVASVQKNYERAHHRVVFALDSSEHLQLLDDFDEFLANPPIAVNVEEAEAAEKRPKKKDDPLGDGVENAAMADSSAADAKGVAEVDTEATTEPSGPTPQAESQPATTKTATTEELDTTAILLNHLGKAFSKLRRRHNLVLDGREDADLPKAELDERYHDVRKATKRLRYSAEAAQNADLPTEKLYAACKNLQSVLGDSQDTCTARDLVPARTKRASRVGKDTLGYGVLYKMEYYDGLKALDEYDDAVAKVSKAFRKMEKKIKKDKRA